MIFQSSSKGNIYTCLLYTSAKARVTVRANIRQLVGGAGEDTILARVGEGIVSSIGSSAVSYTHL